MTKKKVIEDGSVADAAGQAMNTLAKAAVSVFKMAKEPRVKMMRPDHPHWKIFADRLQGKQYLNVREDKRTKDIKWTCYHDHRFTKKTLSQMGYTDEQIEKTLAYYRQQGGYCDCEIIFNIHLKGSEE